MNNLLDNLAKTKFRGKFHLTDKDKAYINEKGIETIKKHAYDFVIKRLSNPINDGRQTPMKGHPVFIAQHASGTCCRGCIERIHKISKNRPLTSKQIDYIVTIIMLWIEREIKYEN